MKTFYRDNDIDAIRKILADQIKDFIIEAQVKTVSNNKSQATVSINGSYNQQSVSIQRGLTVSPEDWVFMVRSKRTSRWTIIGAYINQADAAAKAATSGTALAPSNLTLIPAINAFVARWTVGVDTSGTFEVEIANDTAETAAVTLLIAGSILPYATTITKYVRVRTVSSDWSRSGWTAWVSVTPITSISLANGGTGSDLSATGPGYVKQAATGAGLSVGPIAQADLPVFTGDSGSGGAKGAVPAPGAGDTAAAKFLKADGSWAVPAGSGGGSGGHIIQDNGSDMTARSHLNFIGATVADNAGDDSTDVTITGGGSGGVSTKKAIQTRTVLYDQTLGSNGTWDVSGIDQTYDHLEIIFDGEVEATDNRDFMHLTFNHDTTVTNYHAARADQGNSGTASTGYNSSYFGTIPASGDSFKGSWYFNIPNYASTVFKKNVLIDGTDLHGDGSTVYARSDWFLSWNNTAAINRIEIYPDTSGKQFVAGSRLQIIGIKTEEVVTDVAAIVATTKEFQQRTVLYDTTLSADGAFDVSGIDQNYDHLEVIASLRASDSGGTETVIYLSANGDNTDANYRSVYLYGGTSAANGLASNRFIGYGPADGSDANVFAHVQFQIPNYTGSKIKTTEALVHSPETSTVRFITMGGWRWNNTAAINRLAFIPSAGTTWLAGSRLQIIGVKAEQVVTDVQGVFLSASSIANQNHALIQDQKSSGTEGGGFTSGSWQTRVLNTIANNMANPVLLSSNQLTIPAGTYRIRASVPAYYVNRHQARLYNITDGATSLVGTAEYTQAQSDGIVTHSVIDGVLVLASSKAFEVQHYCQTTKNTDGLGLANSTGEIEVYTTVEIERLDTPTIGVTSPTRATMWHDESTVTVGNASQSDYSAIRYGSQTYQNTAADGDTFTNSFFLQAGTYTFLVLGSTGNDRAKIDWYIDDVKVISLQDWYSGSVVNNVIKSTGSIVVTSSGYHVLKGVVNGHNGGSSDYYMALTKYWLKPSAD